jgi:hypothetical protein
MPEASASLDGMDRYRRSLTRAQLVDLMGAVTGAKTDLVSYDEVANRLRSRQQIEMGTQMVPLSKIVGSVGRYRDFTRTFLPRHGINAERWARVDAVMNSMEGFPPVELYRIGDVYFVRDGNHRVSVARANNLEQIEAYVTEIPTNVLLTQEDFERDQWIIKIERAEFEKETKLDELRPDNDLRLTEPGRYRILLRHIQVHQYFRNLELDRAGSRHRLDWDEGVTSWYDNIYIPVVESIRRHNLLESFPGRTEADLYLWIAYHREQLAKQYDLAPLSAEAAVATFAETHSERAIESAMQGLKLGIRRLFGGLDRPLGMSIEEFADARARHDAGERTVLQAREALHAHDEFAEREEVMVDDLGLFDATSDDLAGVE